MNSKTQYKLALGTMKAQAKQGSALVDIFDVLEDMGVSLPIAAKAWNTYWSMNQGASLSLLLRNNQKMDVLYHAFDKLAFDADTWQVRIQAEILMWGAYSMVTGKYPHNTVQGLKKELELQS